MAGPAMGENLRCVAESTEPLAMPVAELSTTPPLDEAMAGLRSVYQPIVELETGRLVGYEALARGPVGTLAPPAALFAAAARAGRVTELDWACRAAAFRGALEGGLDDRLALFVNVEPSALSTPCPAPFRSVVDEAKRRLRVVVEVTERDLTSDPAGLLAAVEGVRADGWSVALDDVGADPASLALMPFLRPDVVKLDLSLVQGRSRAQVSSIAAAVQAEAERTGATVLAEGIETEDHRDAAAVLGATIGQGWLLGRPGPLGPVETAGVSLDPVIASPLRAHASPFDLVSERRPVRRAAKHRLVPMSTQLERSALDRREPPAVVLSTFQHAGHFTPATAARYSGLATLSSLVVAAGVGLGGEPAPGVRGAALGPDDPLRGEWDVVVVGPQFAGALVARDLGDDGPDAERRFDFALTHDRDLVLAAARCLLARVVPFD